MRHVYFCLIYVAYKSHVWCNVVFSLSEYFVGFIDCCISCNHPVNNNIFGNKNLNWHTVSVVM